MRIGRRPWTRRARAGAWPVLVLVALAAACGRGEEELPPAVTRPVTLRIAAFAGPETTALFRIVPEWEHITGNSVEIGILDARGRERRIARDYESYRNAVIGNAAEGGGAYDVVMVDDPWMPFLAGNGHLAPLSPFGHEADPDIVDRSAALGVWPPTSGPLPPDQAGVPRGAETYALPLVGNAMMLWYRGDIIDEPQTMDGLVASLESPDPAFVGAAGLAPSNNPHVFLTWLASRGGDIFDREWRPGPLRTNLARDALAEYLREATRLDVPFEEYVDERFASHARMLDGTASAAIAWAADAQQILTSSVSDQLRVTAFPEGRRSSSLTGNWLLGIPADGSNQEVAYDFITWATSRDIMKTSALLGVPPTRESLFNDRELTGRYPWLPDVQRALADSFARPRIPAWDVVEGILACALDEALQHAVAVERETPDAGEAYRAIARESLLAAAADVEGVMEEWGYYRGDEFWAGNEGARIEGDPRDTWTCGGGT